MFKKRYYFLAALLILVVVTYILLFSGLKIYVEKELNDYFSEEVKVDVQMPHLSFKKNYIVFPDIVLKNTLQNINKNLLEHLAMRQLFLFIQGKT